MRRILISCLPLLLCGGLLCAQPIQKTIQLKLATGYQREDLNWSIAGNQDGQSPNIYSELQWKKVGGQSLSASLQWNFWNRLVLTGEYSHVAIRSGTVSDHDYNGDNRTDPAYAQLFNADKGFTRDILAGLGYRVLNTGAFSFTPYAGYRTATQSLFLLDRTGQFPDLNSTYETGWQGPFIKAEASAKLLNKLTLTGEFAYNQADYKARADWNLIPTFQHPVSYRHTAKGYGIDANASLVYNITKNIGVNAGGGYFNWQTGKGIDELYLQSGGSQKTQLNGVDRSGYRFFGGIILSY